MAQLDDDHSAGVCRYPAPNDRSSTPRLGHATVCGGVRSSHPMPGASAPGLFGPVGAAVAPVAKAVPTRAWPRALVWHSPRRSHGAVALTHRIAVTWAHKRSPRLDLAHGPKNRHSDRCGLTPSLLIWRLPRAARGATRSWQRPWTFGQWGRTHPPATVGLRPSPAPPRDLLAPVGAAAPSPRPRRARLT